MVSSIDATKPIDGAPASKADLRANLAAAKSEIEALQLALGNIPTSQSGLRNRILNGNFRVDRRAYGTMPINATQKLFHLDRWQAGSEVAGGATFNISSVVAFNGKTGLQLTVTANKTPSATDRHWVAQTIEGASMYDLAWGQTAAQQVVLTFWVRSSVPGTYAVALQSPSLARSRIGQYTIGIANTWTFCTVNFGSDTVGTWSTATTAAWTLRFDLGTGTTYHGSTANIFANGDQRALASNTALSATAGASIAFADVQLEQGVTATPFERRPDTLEQLLTGRYWENGQFNIATYGVAGGTIFQAVPFTVIKRVSAPTIARSSETLNNLNTTSTPSAINAFLPTALITVTGSAAWSSAWTADAELAL